MIRIAMIRLSSLGDLVHTVPAAARIKAAMPDARISWFVEPPGDRLLKIFAGIDEIEPVRLRGQGVARALGNAGAARRRHAAGFSAVLDFQGLIKSALFGRFLSGRHFGFHRSNLREPLAGLFYGRRASPFDERRHVILKNLHLLSLLGIEGAAVAYPQNRVVPSLRLQAFLLEHRLGESPFAVLNVGGGWPTKLLPDERWREVIGALQGDCPLVVIWGNPPERLRAEQVAAGTKALPAPELDFPDLAALLAAARLVISADTLPLHLADAVGTPSLGLFGPTAPGRNGSLLPQSRALCAPLECRFCYLRRCATIRCMKSLSVASIVAAVRDMLPADGRTPH